MRSDGRTHLIMTGLGSAVSARLGFSKGTVVTTISFFNKAGYTPLLPENRISCIKNALMIFPERNLTKGHICAAPRDHRLGNTELHYSHDDNFSSFMAQRSICFNQIHQALGLRSSSKLPVTRMDVIIPDSFAEFEEPNDCHIGAVIFPFVLFKTKLFYSTISMSYRNFQKQIAKIPARPLLCRISSEGGNELIARHTALPWS